MEERLPKIRKNRQPKNGKANLPENRYQVTAVHRLASQPPRRPAPRVVSTERLPRMEVEDRVLRAMMTLRVLPDNERRFFIVRSSSPDYVQEAVTAYTADNDEEPRFRPTPFDVSDCLNALAWLRHLDRPAWQMIWWRSFGVSFGLIGKRIGRSDEAARKRYENAMTDVWLAANRP